MSPHTKAAAFRAGRTFAALVFLSLLSMGNAGVDPLTVETLGAHVATVVAGAATLWLFARTSANTERIVRLETEHTNVAERLGRMEADTLEIKQDVKHVVRLATALDAHDHHRRPERE